MDIERFIDDLAIYRSSFEYARTLYSPRLAPDFTIFDFVQNDENGISRLLAWMLDPGASHAQGTKFLKSFIDAQGLNWPTEAIDLAEVTTERPVRIDVCVQAVAQGRSYVLAIENKLRGAADQTDQLTRYFEHLKSKHDARIIYLTINGREPTPESLSAAKCKELLGDGKLLLYDASKLSSWLQACANQTLSERVSRFLEDFAASVDRSILGKRDDAETNQMVTWIKKSPERVAAWMSIITLEADVRSSLVNEFRDVLLEKGKSRKLTIQDWALSSDRYAGFSVHRQNEVTDRQVYFEFQSPNFQELRYGVIGTGLPPSDRIGDSRRQLLISAFGDAPLGGGDWIWVKSASAQDSLLPIPGSWRYETAPWQKMADGSLATMFLNCAEQLLAAAYPSSII